MEYKNFIFGLFIILIPLVLFVLWYRNYVYNYCKNDMKCLKQKLIFNLDNLNNRLKIYNNNINTIKNEEENNKLIKEKYNTMEEKDDNIEGFFGGLSNWFSGSSPSNLPISPGSLPNEDLSILEKKINDRMKISNKFPPSDLNGNTDDFKDSDNSEILGNIEKNKKPNNIKSDVLPNIENNNPSAIFDTKKPDKESLSLPPPPSIPSPKLDIKSLLGKCQFFNDKCPDKYNELGNFSIQGIGNGSILTCGNVQNTKPAKAVAQAVTVFHLSFF
jgi:hypothetical protein